MQDSVLAESKAALAREAAARRKLHNLVQELRGNIRVFARVKPADARAKGAPVLACEDGHRIACTAAGATKARSYPRQSGNPTSFLLQDQDHPAKRSSFPSNCHWISNMPSVWPSSDAFLSFQTCYEGS